MAPPCAFELAGHKYVVYRIYEWAKLISSRAYGTVILVIINTQALRRISCLSSSTTGNDHEMLNSQFRETDLAAAFGQVRLRSAFNGPQYSLDAYINELDLTRGHECLFNLLKENVSLGTE